MSALPRRVAAVAIVAIAAVLGGCSGRVPPSASVAPPSSVVPSLTPVPGGPSPAPALTPPPTSNPEFGPIWDALPPSWPELAGQSESEIGTDASAMLVVKGDPESLARELQAALTKLGWTVDVGSPLEDGSVVLDATHEPLGCRVEARFSPVGPGSADGTLRVYYGAGCPFA